MALDCLRISGYINEKTAESTEIKVRRAILRAGIAEVDAPVWLGMFRQILWKLENNR